MDYISGNDYNIITVLNEMSDELDNLEGLLDDINTKLEE